MRRVLPLSRRRRAVRSKVVRVSSREVRAASPLYPEDVESLRPRVRGECEGGMRPCPFVSCKHHLYLDVLPNSGAIRFTFPDLDVVDLAETCALDVAANGGSTLEEVGELLNLTRERVRQIEVRGRAKMKKRRALPIVE